VTGFGQRAEDDDVELCRPQIQAEWSDGYIIIDVNMVHFLEEWFPNEVFFLCLLPTPIFSVHGVLGAPSVRDFGVCSYIICDILCNLPPSSSFECRSGYSSFRLEEGCWQVPLQVKCR
jgi:hypothetical protein